MTQTVSSDPAPLTAEASLKPGDAARVLGICVKTLTHWADTGRIRCFRTGGAPRGHRRYPAFAVRAALEKRWDDATRVPSLDEVHPDDLIVVERRRK